MELEENAFGAATAIGRREGAPAAITHPHCALHPRRDVARATGRARVAASSIPRPGRPRDRGQLLASDIFKQERQCPVEDGAGIAIGDLAAQEILGLAQLLVRRGAHGELHAVALRRQGGDSWSVRGWWRCAQDPWLKGPRASYEASCERLGAGFGVSAAHGRRSLGLRAGSGRRGENWRRHDGHRAGRRRQARLGSHGKPAHRCRHVRAAAPDTRPGPRPRACYAPRAWATSVSKLSGRRCGASSRAVLRFREPSASRSRIAGKRRLRRAASMRL